jgi:hypothetical protein
MAAAGNSNAVAASFYMATDWTGKLQLFSWRHPVVTHSLHLLGCCCCCCCRLSTALSYTRHTSARSWGERAVVVRRPCNSSSSCARPQ